MCYDAGVDAKTTQKWMGHADAATTMKIYTKLSEGKEMESTDLMDSFSEMLSGDAVRAGYNGIIWRIVYGGDNKNPRFPGGFSVVWVERFELSTS